MYPGSSHECRKNMKEEWKINAFPKTGLGPWPTGCISEQDDSPELGPKQANYYLPRDQPESVHLTCDWTCFHGKVKEVMPKSQPDPLGEPVDLHMMVDADWAGDKANR